MRKHDSPWKQVIGSRLRLSLCSGYRLGDAADLVHAPTPRRIRAPRKAREDECGRQRDIADTRQVQMEVMNSRSAQVRLALNAPRPVTRKSSCASRRSLVVVVIGVDEGTRALSLFSLLTTVYLLYLGIGSGPVGPRLWRASALHAGVAILLDRDLLSSS